MIHTRIHTGDGRKVVDPPHEEIARFRADPSSHIWVDLESPTSDELDFVASTFNLMDLTVEDFLHRGQRAKLEGFDGYNVLIMHGMIFNRDDLSVETPELDIVLSNTYLITSHEGKMPEILKDPQGPEHACGQLGKSPTLALYGVVDRLVDAYYPVLEEIDDTIDKLEERILADSSPAVLQQIFTLKHSLGFLRKVISPQLEVFNRLISREDEFIDPKYVVYFRDIYDHLARTFEVIDSYRDLMSSAMDAYLSMVSNRQNEVMKRLTVFATIFLPITFVTGVFGQNFGTMPQVIHDNGYFWWFALGGMALLSVGQIVYYKRNGWL
jgi:magnesium transporter